MKNWGSDVQTLKHDLSSDHRLIDGRKVQCRIFEEVGAGIILAVENSKVGRLVSISIGKLPEIAVYVRNQARGAEAVGLRFDEQSWASDISANECKARIVAMNDDPDVLGTILQRPVPGHINVRTLQSAIHPLKDVALAPCTAAASVELIRETGLDMQELEVVMIGHSEIVGKPAAFLLMAEGATVTVCHHMTRSVAMHSRHADVVVVAVGKQNQMKQAQLFATLVPCLRCGREIHQPVVGSISPKAWSIISIA